MEASTRLAYQSTPTPGFQAIAAISRPAYQNTVTQGSQGMESGSGSQDTVTFIAAINRPSYSNIAIPVF